MFTGRGGDHSLWLDEGVVGRALRRHSRGCLPLPIERADWPRYRDDMWFFACPSDPGSAARRKVSNWTINSPVKSSSPR